ncbi:MAG: tetratricopeptide repeat protein [Bacteroidia bacterium]
MKNRYSIYVVLAVFLSLMSWCSCAFAQKTKLDSLFIRYENEKSDTGKINRLYYIIWEYQKNASYDSVLKYANLGIAFATEKNLEQKEAGLYKYIGIAYKNKALYSKALENYLAGLKITEKYNDLAQQASILTNIGGLYLLQKKYTEAEEYLEKALKLSEAEGNKRRVAQIYLNFASLYASLNNDSAALDFYFKAIKEHTALGNIGEVVVSLENIGVLYHTKKEYKPALKYYSEALELAQKHGNKKHIGDLYGNIAQIYVCFNDDPKAVEYFLKAISLSDSIGTLETLMSNLFGLSNIYARMGNMTDAYHTFRKATNIKDSLYNKSKVEEYTRHELKYQFDKKAEAAERENEQRVYKEKLITRTVAVGLFVVLVFAAFILRSLSTTRKQKQIIELKNAETEQQKKIIEEKNKDIMDSIHYAKRIQSALLREEEHVSTHLPEHFIVFQPKDVVSGDFYWSMEKQEHWYFAVADCTGHGVPGAIMSMLGISFLNDVVLSDDKPTPAEVLNRLRDRVVYELRQNNESIGNKDGMDISLCCLNLKTLELQWAGANNPLNILRNGKLEITKADKQPIGYYPAAHPFTNHKMQLLKGDSIYIYSDGYADQFGGPKGKKLTYKRFEAALVDNSSLSMNEQKQALLKVFNDWKGNQEQVDDVCIVGVRV